MSQQVPEYLRDAVSRVARHEMGHYVVARVLGFRTGSVELLIDAMGVVRGGAEIFPFEPVQTVDDISAYLHRRLQVLYAGVSAESLSAYGTPVQKVDQEAAIKELQSSAADDSSKARELTRLLAGINFQGIPDEATCNARFGEIGDLVWDSAVEIVEAQAETIHGLALNLSARVNRAYGEFSISADELEALPGVRALTATSTQLSGT